MLQGPSIPLSVEVPQQLHDRLQMFLGTHANWDVDQVVAIALARFLKSREETLQLSALAARERQSLAEMQVDSLSLMERRLIFFLRKLVALAMGSRNRNSSH